MESRAILTQGKAVKSVLCIFCQLGAFTVTTPKILREEYWYLCIQYMHPNSIWLGHELHRTGGSFAYALGVTCSYLI